MKYIRLTQGKFALVDDADFEWLNQWKWHYRPSKNGKGYASRFIGSRKNRSYVHMHHLLLLPVNGLEIDHKDRNSLNNCRNNLRYATHRQNLLNKSYYMNNKSGFKGVTSVGNRWRARIRNDKKYLHLGYFSTPHLAALAYDKAAALYHGKFAYMNGVST